MSHTPDDPVDIHVTDEAYKVLAVMLKEQNIQFQISISDVEKMMNDEVQACGMEVGFNYSRYYPLDEVIPVFFNVVVLVYAVNSKDQIQPNGLWSYSAISCGGYSLIWATEVCAAKGMVF